MNPSTEKKKQTNVTKFSFEGIASGVNPMKGIVVAVNIMEIYVDSFA